MKLERKALLETMLILIFLSTCTLKSSIDKTIADGEEARVIMWEDMSSEEEFPPAGWGVWNTGWDFELGQFDTGGVSDQIYEATPWGSDYWGIRGYTWKKDEPGLFPLHLSRFSSDGHSGSLYGWEERGDWGVVTYIQGDMYAINVWFKSPYLRNEAADCEKRLVMDLVFYVDGSNNQVESFVDLDRYESGEPNSDASYHYQAKIYSGENPTPYRTWKSWKINLNKHIDEALKTDWKYWNETLGNWVWVGPIENPDEVKASLTLYQLEFILEVKHAVANCDVDSFYLIYALLGDIDSDGLVGLADLYILAKAYGSQVGDSTYVSEADIDDDGYIGLADYSIFAMNYGKSVS